MPRVLVTKHVYPEAIDLLEKTCEVDYNDARIGMPPEDLARRLAGKDAVICQLTDKMSPAVMDVAPDLKVIANVAVGFDNIDIPAASARGIVAAHTPGVLTETTADMAFMLIMAAGRRLTEAERFLRRGEWREWYVDLLCGYDIHGATLGIYGLGRIGQAVARRARGFGMKVLYYDVNRLDESIENNLDAAYVDFDRLLTESDFLSVHAPLTPDTRHAIGAPEFAKMKKTAVLVNTARGPLVDEAALADALEAKTIAAAGLDVFEGEPNVHPKLLGVPNVVLTPHIASASIATRTKMCLMAAENVLAVLNGQKAPNALNDVG